MELQDAKKLLVGYHSDGLIETAKIGETEHLVVTGRTTNKDKPAFQREVQLVREAMEAIALPTAIPRPVEITSNGHPVVYSQMSQESKKNMEDAGITLDTQKKASRADRPR